MKRLFAALAILLVSFGLVACTQTLTVTDIEVTAPTKLAYEVDDEFNPAGLIVRTVMSDGSKVALAPTDYTLTGFTSATAGQKTVTVTVGEFTKTFVVTINAPVAPDAVQTGIEVTPPTKLSYKINEALVTTGLVVKRVFDDGSKPTLNPDQYQLVGFSSAAAGTVVVTVLDGAFAGTFTVTVLSAQTLTVGSPAISGEFIGGFGNSAYDVWVRNLVHGYETITTTPGGDIIINETVVVNDPIGTTVLGPERSVNVGTVDVPVMKTVRDKTYTFEIAQDLYWSDGTQVMAKDYVFALLFAASNNWANAGASSTAGRELLGYAAYRPAGTPRPTSVGLKFAGVKLLSDFSFSLTIDGVNLPYFYELTMVGASPMPMHVLTPAGTTVISDADGATLSANGLNSIPDIIKIGGYRYNPFVTSGPYKFESFINQIVTVVINPYFKGNYAGQKPTIDRVIIRNINQTLDVDMVIAGDIDLTTGVIEGAKIDKAKASATADVVFYARNGYGMIAMHCDFGPTQDYRVRQAIGYLVERQKFVDEILGGYGSMVDGMYGLSQWMYEAMRDELEEELNAFSFNPATANALIAETEWKYEADGTTLFDPVKAAAQNTSLPEGGIWPYNRYNAAGEPMIVNHMGTTNNNITDLIGVELPKGFKLAGIGFTLKYAEFSELLDNYYYAYELAPENRIYHTFNLATNFGVAFDPYYSVHTDWLGTWQNANQIEDSPANPAAPLEAGEKTLNELTKLMRELDPGQKDLYLEYWFQFQVRYNKLLPNLPIYSNEYYDIYNKRISGVLTTPFWNWSLAICDIRIVG